MYLTTGQDFGHGVMSDGKTQSLEYMLPSVSAAMCAPTPPSQLPKVISTPLPELSKASGIKMDASNRRILGCGNIGSYLFERLHAAGAKTYVLEASDAKRKALEERGIPTWGPEDKAEFLKLPIDVLALNANGGSLDAPAIGAINQNEAIEFICGCENLVMPVEHGAEILRQGRKLYTDRTLRHDGISRRR